MMKKFARLGTLIFVMASVLLTSSWAMAKVSGGKPAGFGKGKKKGWHDATTPPGWNHGEKKGWEGQGTPSGLAKK